jgi:hypothetical protein
MWEKLTHQREIPTDIKQIEEQFYQQQIFFRQVTLEGKWWRCCSGKLLAFTADADIPVILTPHFADYSFVHPESGQRCRAGRDHTLLKPEAFSLCYPLPPQKLTIGSFMGYALRQLSVYDGIFALMACLAVVLLTMFTPYVCKVLFNEVIPSGDTAQLVPIATLLFSAAVGLVTVQLIRNLLVVRMKDKTEYALQAPLMTRLLMLPTTFFKRYAPGDLSNRVLSVVRASTVGSRAETSGRTPWPGRGLH